MAPLRAWIAAREGLATVASAKIDPLGATEALGEVDRSIFALKDLKEGEVLVTLRPGAFLSGSSWLARIAGENKSVDGKALEEATQTAQLSATALTALALMTERAAGTTSDFCGYIEQLPKSVPLPLSWTKEQQQLLKHTTASPLVDAELVEKIFDSYINPLVTKFPALWPDNQGSLASFRWAYSIVSSRAFAIGDGNEPTLLPVIDMANHDADDPAARIEKSEAGDFQLVVVRDVAESDAVTISYGDLSNAQLLCRYGFVLPLPVPSDSILISSSELSSTFKAYLHSATVADDEDYVDSGSDSDDQHGASGGSGKQKKGVKRRKVFDSREANEADSLFFLLHGDQTREFGLGDALLSYVLAANLPAEELYEVLTILLRRKDKQYSDAIASLASAEASEGEGEVRRVAALLSQHERQVCRRILLGLVTLEEESEEDDDEEEEEEEDE